MQMHFFRELKHSHASFLFFFFFLDNGSDVRYMRLAAGFFITASPCILRVDNLEYIRVSARRWISSRLILVGVCGCLKLHFLVVLPHKGVFEGQV